MSRTSSYGHGGSDGGPGFGHGGGPVLPTGLLSPPAPSSGAPAVGGSVPSAGGRALAAPLLHVPRSYCTSTDTGGSIAHNASVTLTFTTGMREIIQHFRGQYRRWALTSAMGDIDGAGNGPFQLQTWRASGFNLFQNFVVHKALVPLQVLMPEDWDGALTCVATNRSGAGGALHMTVWVAPVGGA